MYGGPIASLPPDWQALAINKAYERQSIVSIAISLGISVQDFWILRKRHPEFNTAFEEGRRVAAECIEDSVLTAHDDIPDIMKARLYSDNAKWVMSRRDPSKYGDKSSVEVNHRGSIDLLTAISQGNARLPENKQKAEAALVEYADYRMVQPSGPVPNNSKEVIVSTLDDMLS